VGPVQLFGFALSFFLFALFPWCCKPSVPSVLRFSRWSGSMTLREGVVPKTPIQPFSVVPNMR